MKRRIAFYLAKANHLRVAGPVIRHLIQQEDSPNEVVILYPSWPIKKFYLQVDPGVLRSLFGERIGLHGLERAADLESAIQRLGIQVVFNVTPELNELSMEQAREILVRTRRSGVKWMSLPFTVHEERMAVNHPEYIAACWDCIGVRSPQAIAVIKEQLKQRDPALAEDVLRRLHIVGYPLLDGAESFKREAILAKYGLPEDRPIIYLSVAPSYYMQKGYRGVHAGFEARFLGVNGSPLRAWASALRTLGTPVVVPYRRYLAALRAFADRNGAYLIAKTREKQKERDPGYLSEYVDQVIDDVSYFPFTTLELLRVSSLYVGFASFTALEAVALGVYALTVLSMPRTLLFPQGFERLRAETLFTGEGGLWNTPGVSELIDGTQRGSYKRLEELAGSRLDAFRVNGTQREALLERLVSFRGRSAAAVSDALDSLLSEQPRA